MLKMREGNSRYFWTLPIRIFGGKNIEDVVLSLWTTTPSQVKLTHQTSERHHPTAHELTTT